MVRIAIVAALTLGLCVYAAGDNPDGAGKADGRQFITGACASAADCASKCCAQKKKGEFTCAAPGALGQGISVNSPECKQSSGAASKKSKAKAAEASESIESDDEDEIEDDDDDEAESEGAETGNTDAEAKQAKVIADQKAKETQQQADQVAQLEKLKAGQAQKRAILQARKRAVLLKA